MHLIAIQVSRIFGFVKKQNKSKSVKDQRTQIVWTHGESFEHTFKNCSSYCDGTPASIFDTWEGNISELLTVI